MAQPLDWRGKSRNGNVASIIGSVLVLQQNARRVGATIVNNGITIKFLSKGEVAYINQGIPLYPNGGAYEIGLNNPYPGAISVYCGVAAENIAWTEDE